MSLVDKSTAMLQDENVLLDDVGDGMLNLSKIRQGESGLSLYANHGDDSSALINTALDSVKNFSGMRNHFAAEDGTNKVYALKETTNSINTIQSNSNKKQKDKMLLKPAERVSLDGSTDMIVTSEDIGEVDSHGATEGTQLTTHEKHKSNGTVEAKENNTYQEKEGFSKPAFPSLRSSIDAGEVSRIGFRK